MHRFMVNEIYLPSTFEQLRTTAAGNKIHVLVEHLVRNVTNPALINALLLVYRSMDWFEADMVLGR